MQQDMHFNAEELMKAHLTAGNVIQAVGVDDTLFPALRFQDLDQCIGFHVGMSDSPYLVAVFHAGVGREENHAEIVDNDGVGDWNNMGMGLIRRVESQIKFALAQTLIDAGVCACFYSNRSLADLFQVLDQLEEYPTRYLPLAVSQYPWCCPGRRDKVKSRTGLKFSA